MPKALFRIPHGTKELIASPPSTMVSRGRSSTSLLCPPPTSSGMYSVGRPSRARRYRRFLRHRSDASITHNTHAESQHTTKTNHHIHDTIAQTITFKNPPTSPPESATSFPSAPHPAPQQILVSPPLASPISTTLFTFSPRTKKRLTSIIMHHTNPHHPVLLPTQPQHIVHQPLTIEMPPPARKP